MQQYPPDQSQSYPYPQSQPPQYAPPPVQPPPKKKRRLLWLWIIIGIFVVAAACSGLVQGIQSANTPAPTPTQAVQSQATSAPTQPTPTPKPLSTADQAKQIADGTTHIGTNITAKYDSTNNALSLSEYLDTNAQLNNGSIIFSIKSDCFNIQQAIWQAHLKGVDFVLLDITAPLQDQFGNVKTGELAYCTLHKDTAAKFNWGNLLPDTAWPVYDSEWYLPSLNQ